MSYKVYKKHVNKYGKKANTSQPGASQTQSVYLFSGRSVTPDKKPIINVKKSSNIYGRASGASTDRSHNLNRNLSLTAISGTGVTQTYSRNLKTKGSISSSSSYNHQTSNSKMSTSKSFRHTTAGEESEKELKLMDTIKLLKGENK